MNKNYETVRARIWGSFLLLAALFADLSAAHAADESDAQNTVRCNEIAFSNALETDDVSRFRELLDPDVRFVSSAVLRGPDEVIDGWRAYFAKDGPELIWRPHIVEVLEDQNIAISRGPYRFRHREEDGTPVESWGMFNTIWRLNAEGEWRVLIDAGNAGSDAVSDDMRKLITEPDGVCAA